MTIVEFAKYLNSIRETSNSTVETWHEWAKELESYDSSDGELPKGEYKEAEVFLSEFAERIKEIRAAHGDDIAAQIISLADLPACPFPWEMKLAAEHLANGGSIEDIPEMEKCGTLEDFSDIKPNVRKTKPIEQDLSR